MYLGSHYPIPREQWGALRDRVDDILHHQPCLFPLTPDIEEEAQRLASKLIGTGSRIRSIQVETLHIRKASRPKAWQQTIYNALDLSNNLGGTMKTIIADRK